MAQRSEGSAVRRAGRSLAIGLGCLIALAGTARADKVDDLIKQLRGSGDYKVRLSAALNLSKLSDPRAVDAFTAALADSDKTVRGVAVAGLGKQITCDTAAATRKKIDDALKKAASSDRDAFVRKQAQKAIDAVAELGCDAVATPRGGTYVNIGAMAAPVSGGDALKKLMRSTAQKTFRSKAAAMAIEWSGGKDPTAKQLAASQVTGFHVDGTLNEVTVDGAGTVSCKVSMLLATYPEKSMFGFLKGGAQVQGGSSSSDVQYAKEDCVTAVIEDLIARKIIPTIQARTK
jgi:hypothetical protein